MSAEPEDDVSLASGKLLIYSKVEVRSLDCGFHGSWHPGTVISCSDDCRVVQYDNLLAYDGYYLTDIVPVSPTGLHRSNYRGRIRPLLPPHIPFGPLDLVYGLCVDVSDQLECWREGVVFDHNDGADKRLVFFPDLGDDEVAEISRLRISQNWVEECDTWQPTGIWCFLQVIDDYYSRENRPIPNPVSVKQLWYELQGTEGFEQIKEWNIGERSVWENLVLKTICENLAIDNILGNVDELIAADSKKEELSVVKFTDSSSSSVDRISSKVSKKKKKKKKKKEELPRNIISWLIDNRLVHPREKVYFCDGDSSDKLGEGRVQLDGIKCSCCNQVFSLSGFSVHAGSTSSRLSKNIFLEDGRSLLECLAKICAEKSSMVNDHDDDEDWKFSGSDSICSICYFGGDLISCHFCTSSYHVGCLGLEDVPHGTWFCRSCCCCFCGKSNLKTDSSDLNVLKCSQCERKYHVGCLREREEINPDNLPDGNWFCNTNCKKISVGLSELLGKPVNVVDDVTWTLLKFVDPNIHSEEDTLEFESSVENYVWLKIAVELMHECFEPVKEHHALRDLVEDIVFSRRSELNRLNFQGFYTVILKKGDELVSVATIRIHGEKVAEIPLIGTRSIYRRQGMGHILLNELEKLLRELGVERLLLSAVSTIMNTWITSFGYSKMEETDRLQFLDYTLLEYFQESVTCQKHLLMP